MDSPPRPQAARARSSTIVGTGSLPPGSTQRGPPTIDLSASSFRITTNPQPSAAAEALTNLKGSAKRPRMRDASSGHNRVSSWPSPPQPVVTAMPSAPAVPTRATLEGGILDLSLLEKERDSATLLLYTYRPPISNAANNNAAHPFPLPSTSASPTAPSSQVTINYAALPWDVKPGDYLEIRKIARPKTSRSVAPMRIQGLEGETQQKVKGSPAIEGVKPGKGREGYVFRLGDDSPNTNIHQIQVPDSVASAFGFQNRLEVEVRRVHDKESAHTDYVELYFSQYLGRADMWRLGMSLEGTTLHVGEKVSLAGGAVRAEVNFIIRSERDKDGTMIKPKKYSSGIVTAKTKTIFRSKSAQVYIFIQLCEETWQFDEDGERYVEKVVHGYLPELFARWAEKGTSHVATIIFFARIFYRDDEVEYLRKHDMTDMLCQDHSGQWYKDFFKVAVDLERRNDWMSSLPEIKRQLERSEREILLDYHLGLLRAKGVEEEIRIVGKWSFAYQGNVLEAINLALNPFDEHYVDRDLSRTGLSITVVTPGTGHFAVDKNVLRLTTERMVDHGITTDFVCLTKMPLHSVPLFSYITHKPKGPVYEDGSGQRRLIAPDLLYFDGQTAIAKDTELSDCYSLPSWVSCSFYAVTHDKPFREDRFVPRCKMYDIQMLGILDHNLTTVTVPLLNVDDTPMPRRPLTAENRKTIRDGFDQSIFSNNVEMLPKIGLGTSPIGSAASGSVSASYQSARLLAEKEKEKSRSLSMSKDRTSSMSMSRPKVLEFQNSKLSPIKAMVEMEDIELGKKTPVREPSPAPSSLSLRRGSRRSLSPTKLAQITRAPQDPKHPTVPSLLPESRVGFPTTATGSLSASPAPPPAETGKDSSMSTAPTATSPPQVDTAERQSSPSRHSIRSVTTDQSGASTPKQTTPGKSLKNQPSKGLLPRWIYNSLSFKPLVSTSTLSSAEPATETATRSDVVGGMNGRSSSPSPSIGSLRGRASKLTNPQAIVTPSTPSPSRIERSESRSMKPREIRDRGKENGQDQGTQPLPIAASKARVQSQSEEDAISRSLRTKSHAALSRSHEDSSLRAAQSNALVQSSRHFTINPCKPSVETIDRVRDAGGRRWRFVLPKLTQQHIVQWPSLIAPACLPLTTDFLPDQKQSDELYTTGTYTVQCYLEDDAFLIRSDAAEANLPLAMMREMVSQRLSRRFPRRLCACPAHTAVENFQVIVQPHELSEPETPRPMPIHLEKDADIGVELLSGGASEVLKNGQGAIWLSWANHIHRLLFHPNRPEIIVHWMTRKIMHETKSVPWKGLVWPAGTNGYQKASATFAYPDVSMKINYNHLDHLINGERADFGPLRYWRTRFILIPSDREPGSFPGVMPKNEFLGSNDLLWLGSQKVMETLSRYLLKYPEGQIPQRSMKIVTTTFDPSTCVLDEELMMDLARQIHEVPKGSSRRKIEGMTLAQVAEAMCMPGNGLVIRTRWWEARQHVSSFNGFELREWLQNNFEDVTSREKAQEWAMELTNKGLIEHVTKSHGFLDYWHVYYRLREPYDQMYKPPTKQEKESKNKSWFSSSSKGSRRQPPSATSTPTAGKGNVAASAIAEPAAAMADSSASTSTQPSATGDSNNTAGDSEHDQSSLAKIYLQTHEDEGKKGGKKRKIVMTQTRVLDLDPNRKSDRAEVAILHADVVHNAKNAFHFELNWLGVTAALLDELRQKLSAQADRYGLRFVETPVEQIADISKKCAFRTAIPIKLALAPPVIPDLHTRLVAVAHGTGQAENYFEYSILTRKFGFVLDVEAADRYPDNVEVVYAYRKGGVKKYTYSQFCHKTGLALVQCVGGEEGFLWSDNRLVVSAPTRRGVGNRVEEARSLRRELEQFCSDKEQLAKFYKEVTPPVLTTGENTPVQSPGEQSAPREERPAQKVAAEVQSVTEEKADYS
ncbi:vacuolar membrane-associated protein IML1 [Cryptococcus amylolentus CBS 6039]|uniref:Vacuolar membrane-associated protein IML1 n=1 Tax=Cryptococcus amylolentus CBS 6039 TaxID=1295533 RepID=A0A1E3HLV4_9TREE|nr:vacuolar membrane-associated protein IML1 [Cryptococcus amylolentus CBS 6039]ODN76686.1 vacuolar membrane-associated protein IML1 [Cryptococcus amylolentus CBS 6039]